MPHGVWWWREQAKRFVEEKSGNEEISEKWRGEMDRVLWGYPTVFGRVGIERIPTAPKSVTRVHIRALKASTIFARSTMATRLVILREFVRWAKNPLAADKGLWMYDRGEPTHRRWLSPEQLGAMYRAAEGREKVVVALEGFNGLRRIEVLRLRVRDLDLDLAGPTMNVLGKGRYGGKLRRIPIYPSVYPVLVGWTHGKAPDTKLYPWHARTADHDLRHVGVKAGLGIRVSGHDLRRSFARISYESGMPLVVLQRILGHKSVEMTSHYVGANEVEMVAQSEKFEAAMRPYLVSAETT
ncbi:MAG TPA: site-specific integrase [Thermoplasmata archaeon]|nr:site-specific integrase [Thermoplasmata archaeon]